MVIAASGIEPDPLSYDTESILQLNFTSNLPMYDTASPGGGFRNLNLFRMKELLGLRAAPGLTILSEYKDSNLDNNLIRVAC